MRLDFARTLSSFAIAIIWLAASPVAEAQDQLPALGDDPRIVAADLEIGVFASGLNFPMGMVVMPDGSLLVSTSVPDGGSFFRSTGELVRLTDDDNNGEADDAGTVLASGLPGPLVALQQFSDLVFVTSARDGESSITILRTGEQWSDPFTYVDALGFRFSNALHQSYGLVVRDTPGESGSYDIVFNLGAHGNVDGGVQIRLFGLVETKLDDSALYLMTIHDDGTTLTADLPVQLATGLRNASALAFDAESGDLIIGENGMDTPGNDIVSLSADEIDIIPAETIGTKIVDFGFPGSYVDYETGELVGSDGVQPTVELRPVEGSESEGIASLSKMPSSFPAELSGGYVAGFHGQFDSYGDDNEENPLIYIDLETGVKFELIVNDNSMVGHFDSLFADDDVLYVADICATGSLAEPTPCGVIYQIRADE